MREECNTCESEMSRIINSLQGNKSKIAVSCFLNQYKIDPTETPNKEFVYIDIDAVGNGTGIWRKDKTIIGKSAPSRARRYAHKGSVLISTVRPNLKGYAYIDEDLDNAVFSTGFAILESQDTNILLNKLLYYEFMYSNTLMEQMVNAMPKGQYPSINKDDINNLEIIVPNDIAYQEAVLSELNGYEERLNEARTIIASSSARKQAIMDKYLK
jgi:restriction endonuclease S subunit